MNVKINTICPNNKIGFTCNDCRNNKSIEDMYENTKSEMDLYISDLYDYAIKNDISNEEFQKHLDFAHREKTHELGNLDILV